ncbi:LysR substrate-binding domain-containing protein [Streptomyces sp. NPDC052107]|uniref:LysR substrate-binding domain-containing protein n=1 Tax=Streptomyces sp. NPDC052107 TaxID=3155632 RepID=UPI0034187A42
MGTIQTLTGVDLPAELAAFHREFPGIQVSVRNATVAELTEALRAGELDLAFVAPEARDLPEGLHAYARWHEELVLINAPGHPPAEAGRTLTKDLAEEAFVDFRAGTGLETAVRRLPPSPTLDGARAGGPPAASNAVSPVTSPRSGCLVDLVRAGTGVAFVPRAVGERAGLPCVRIRQPEPGRTVVLTGRGERPRNPAAAALVRHLTDGAFTHGRVTDAAPAAAGRRGGRRPAEG